MEDRELETWELVLVWTLFGLLAVGVVIAMLFIG